MALKVTTANSGNLSMGSANSGKLIPVSSASSGNLSVGSLPQQNITRGSVSTPNVVMAQPQQQLVDPVSIFVDPKTNGININAPQWFIDSPEFKDEILPFFKQLEGLSLDDERVSSLLSADTLGQINAQANSTLKHVEARESLKRSLGSSIEGITDKAADYALYNMSQASRSDNDTNTQIIRGIDKDGKLETISVADALAEVDEWNDRQKETALRVWNEALENPETSAENKAIITGYIEFLREKGRLQAGAGTRWSQGLQSFMATSDNSIPGFLSNQLSRVGNIVSGEGNITNAELARQNLEENSSLLSGTEGARAIGSVAGDIFGIGADIAGSAGIAAPLRGAMGATKIGRTLDTILNAQRATRAGRVAQTTTRNIIEDTPFNVIFNTSRALTSDEDFGTNMLIDTVITGGLTSAALLGRRALLAAEQAAPGSAIDKINTAIQNGTFKAVDAIQQLPGVGRALKWTSDNLIDDTANVARALRRAQYEGKITKTERMAATNRISAISRGANQRLEAWASNSEPFARAIETGTELRNAGAINDAIDYTDAVIKLERINSGQLQASQQQIEALEATAQELATPENIRYFDEIKAVNDEIVQILQDYGLANKDVINFMRNSDEFADNYIRMQYDVGSVAPGGKRLQASPNLKSKNAIKRLKGNVTEHGAIDPILAAVDYMRGIEEMRLRNELANFMRELGLATVRTDARLSARRSTINTTLKAAEQSIDRAIDDMSETVTSRFSTLLDDLEDPMGSGIQITTGAIDDLIDGVVQRIASDNQFQSTVLARVGDNLPAEDVALEALSIRRDKIKELIERGLDDADFPKTQRTRVNDLVDQRIDTKMGVYGDVELGPFKASTGDSQTDRILRNEDTVAGGQLIGDYYREAKGEDWQIVMMTPDEYLERAARISGDAKTRAEIDDWISKPMGDVEKYTADMRNGDEFPIPYINERSGGQEGRTRALAAKAAGYETIPVAYAKRFTPGESVPQSAEITQQILNRGEDASVGSTAIRGLFEEKKKLNKDLTPDGPKGDNTITYFENGGRGDLEVADPDILEYFNSNKSFAETGAVMRVLIGASRAFRAGTTGFNPIHNLIVEPIRNVARGTIGAGTSVLTPRNMVNTLMESAGMTAQQADEFYRAALARRQESGFGSTFWTMQRNDPNGIRQFERAKELAGQHSGGKVINTLRHPVRSVEDAFNKVDMDLVRRNVFDAVLDRSVKNGYSPEEALERAIFYADESSTSFWRAGAKTRQLMRTIPYLSAAINGQASFLRLWSIDPVGVTARLAGGVVMPVMYLTAQNLLNDNYVNIPEYVKDTNFIVMLPDGDYLKIPLDYDIARVVNPFRAVMEDMAAGDVNVFRTVADALINGSPIDLGGFTERDIQGNIDPGRAAVRALSGLLPTAISGAYEAFKGENLYTGNAQGPTDEELYATGQVDPGEEITAGDRTFRARDSKILRGIADLTGIDQSTLQNVVGNFTGQVGEFLLNGLDKLAGADESQQGGRDFAETLGGRFFNDGRTGLRSTSDWYQGVDDLEAEKRVVQERINQISRDAQYSDDPTALEQQKQEIIDVYGQKVADFANAYGDYYSRVGGLRPTQFDSLIRLLNFGPTENTFQTGTDEWGNQQDAIYAARDDAERIAYELGLPTSTERDRAGRMYLDSEGTPFTDYSNVSTIPGMIQSEFYGAPKQLAYEFEQIIAADRQNGVPSLRDEMSTYYDELDKLFDKASGLKGAAATAAYAEINDLQEQYMTEVFDRRIAPLIEKYGPAVLNNNDVIKELSSYIMVPGDYTPFHSRKKQPYLTADTKEYIRDRYGVGKMSQGNRPSDAEAQSMVEAINADLDAGRQGSASQKLDDLMSEINTGRIAVDMTTMNTIRELIQIANRRR